MCLEDHRSQRVSSCPPFSDVPGKFIFRSHIPSHYILFRQVTFSLVISNYTPKTHRLWFSTCQSLSCKPSALKHIFVMPILQIENHDDCLYDFIEIRDGHAADSPLIGKYCGYKAPEDLVASGNKMFIRFKSDDSIAKGGFSAVFMKGTLRSQCQVQQSKSIWNRPCPIICNVS